MASLAVLSERDPDMKLKRRVASLAVAMLEVGVPERAYLELKLLCAEIGGMPELPEVFERDGYVMLAEGCLN